MNRVDTLSGLWLLLLLAASTYVAGAFSARDAPGTMPGASGKLLDVTGTELPRKSYRRIASASALADGLLLELAEPERIVGLSHQGKLHDRVAEHYRGRAEISGPSDVEGLLALGPDVLIVNQLGAQSELARVRGAGIAVFDLGEMRGLTTLRPAIYALADLLGDRARGEHLWQRFSRKFHAVASDLAPAQRKHAVYVASYAGKLYGGTRGTSYSDVLTAAGLYDAAATRYRGWPQFDPEQLLQLDPEVIVTNIGMAQLLCSNVWLARLRACVAPRVSVLELAPELIGDSGLGMLEAAERLHELAYAKEGP